MTHECKPGISETPIQEDRHGSAIWIILEGGRGRAHPTQGAVEEEVTWWNTAQQALFVRNGGIIGAYTHHQIANGHLLG